MNKTLLSIISVIVPSIIYIKFNDPNYDYVYNSYKLYNCYLFVRFIRLKKLKRFKKL